MSNHEGTAAQDPIITADELRRMLERNAVERAEHAAKLHELEAQKHTLFAAQFMNSDIGPEEMERIRRVVMAAVRDGKAEALVYTFPSALCTDHGRAINNGDPAWPQTLQGQARRFFERWEAVGKPNGYRLSAMIINFPHDLPGEVGFFLSWAPDRF
jgi:hypothetical protein